ncbi:MAG: serine/threonine protein kinase [Candidatus Hydrogenedentes bacterium]|nr:serine/threonine protein kinase [Candidatus Hydrogenedentota bacterium]
MTQQEVFSPDRTHLYRFKVDRILGRGGSGTVYRGLDPETGQVYAVKLFHANFFRNRMHHREIAKTVARFAKFSHLNVVRVYEFISGEEGDCIVQEYVDGPDMKWYVANRPWNLGERLVIVAQICNGLQYIHDQGTIHHDLKPSNILFTRKGVAKIADYCLCRGGFLVFWEGGVHEQITPMFVAPELIQKEKATHKSDLYALGVTMYVLFTGRVPFEVDTLQKVYFCHLRVIPDHPSKVNPACPHALGDIIMKLMDKNPENRFESCDQLRIGLADIGRSRI